MGDNELVMKIPSIAGIKEHPIKVLMGIVVLYSGTLWTVGRPIIVEDLSADFTSRKQMEQHEKENMEQFKSINDKLDYMIQRDNREDAYNTISNIEGDIERHKAVENDTREWRQTQEQLEERLETAIRYKDCIQAHLNHCDEIKERIW